MNDITAKELEQHGYKNVTDGNENYIFAQDKNKLWAIFNDNGEQLTEFLYKEILPYNQGNAIACVDPEKLSNKVWVLDIRNGTYTEEQSKIYAAEIINYKGDRNTNVYCILDKMGAVIGNCYFNEISPRRAEDGVIITHSCNSDKGCFTLDGVFIKPDELKVSKIGIFKDGYAKTTTSRRKNGLISLKGEKLIEPKDILSDFKNGYAVYLDQETDDSGCIDQSGVKYTIKYNQASNRYLYSDEAGNLASTPEPAQLRELIEDSFGVDKADSSIIVDGKGHVLIDNDYQETSPCFFGGIAFVKKNNRWGFVNRKGEELTEMKYKHIGFISKGYGQASNEDEIILVGTQGIIAQSKKGWFGYNNRRKDPETGKLRQSCGGNFWYYIESNSLVLEDELDESVMTKDLEFSQIKTLADGTKCFMTGKKTAVDLNGRLLKEVILPGKLVTIPKLTKKTNSIIQDLEQNYLERPLPALLKEIIRYDDWMNESQISLGFSIFQTSKEAKEWFQSSQNKFYPFARADGTGSIYAFFVEAEQILEHCPIVFFGSEGEINLVASNFTEFLQLLSIGVEPMGSYSELLSFYLDENDSFIPDYQAAFIEWLKYHQIKPITSNYEKIADTIIKKAHKTYFEKMEVCLAKLD